MTPQEFARFLKLVAATWPEADLTPDVTKVYSMDLSDQGFGPACAAVRVLAREGRYKVPSAGTIRRRMTELELDAPDWGEVRRALNERRAQMERRREQKLDWTCPAGTCEGDGWVVDVETNSARKCSCFQERLAASRQTVQLHPLIQEFLDRGYVTLVEVEEVGSPDTKNRTTLEAQMREKWRAFVEDQVSSSVMADLPAGTGLPRIERARNEGLKKLGALEALGLPRGDDAGGS